MTRNELTKLWAKVTGKFNALIDGAPEALDTLKEIADKLGDDDDALAGLLTQLGAKQDALVSGQNIKSINGQSVLGEGNLELGELFVVTMTQHNSVYTADKSVSEIYAASYTNGKPVIAVMRDINNPVFILTDCDPDADSYVFSSIESNTVTTLRWQHHADDYTYELETIVLQPRLVSGTNIKSVNNESLLGSGNVDIVGKSAYQSYVDTTTDSPVKTEAEWVASLKGEDGVDLGEVAIADDLDTDDGTKVLSARQGYQLGQKLNDVPSLQDKIGKVTLEKIVFINKAYIKTSLTIIPNDGTNITTSTTGASIRCAVISVTPGDVFLLNNIGGNYGKAAYVFTDASFNVIKHSGANHICDEESIVAPSDAAWLCLNDNITDKNSYKGKNIQYQIKENVDIETERAENAEQNLQNAIDSSHQIVSDNFGGIELEEIELVANTIIDTYGSSIPNEGGEIIRTTLNKYCSAAVPVNAGDVFLLNCTSDNSRRRAYAWAKSDFTYLEKAVSPYTCNQETLVAPENAAWLIINSSIAFDPRCYKGQSFKNYVDTNVGVEKDSQTGTSTIKVGTNEYQVASDDIAKRLLSSVVIATATVNVSTAGASAQNIINGNYYAKKGSKLSISVTGLITYVRNLELYINNTLVGRISEPTFVYTCDSDVSTIRIFARAANVVADGSVSVTVELLSIYNAIWDVDDKTLGIDNLVYKSDSADVYGMALLSPKWHHTYLINNASQEYAIDDYITSEFIPVDTISFLRISCSHEYSVFRFDKNKVRLTSPTVYTGDNVIAFNSKITYRTKYVRIRVNTANTADITVHADSLLSRLNNKRLLSNKNIKCFGHRGSSLRADISAADNYPSSIWGAYINGFDGVHFNVQFTSDHVPYCLHDLTFVDDASGNTITLNNCTSAEIEGYTRNGQPIAKVESGIYMAKMMGLDVIIYNPYGTQGAEDYDVLVNLVKKYDMFDHTWFGIPGIPGSPNTTYLSKIVAACPRANIMRTEENITSSEYSSITALIADAESLLQTYPNLNIALWINSGYHSEQHFIDANLTKPYNVKLAVHGLTQAKYETIMPYISFYTANIGEWSFGAIRRNVETIVTDKYPEFLLGDYGNII